MIFGFGKEKIGYWMLLSHHKSGCKIIEDNLKSAIERLPEYKNYNNVSEDIDIAIQQYSRAIAVIVLPESEKEEYSLMTRATDLKNYMESPNKKIKTAKEYIDRKYEIEDELEKFATGMPNKTFLAGVFHLLGVEESKINNLIEEVEDDFPMEIAHAGTLVIQNYLKGKRLVMDEVDNELVEWTRSVLPDGIV